MIVLRLLLMTAVWLLFVYPGRAAESKTKLACPSAWPQDRSARLKRVDFTDALEGNGPINFYETPSPYGAEPGDELFCAYGNGRSLLITIPGKPDICYVVKAERVGSQFMTTDAYCVYAKIGDPAKDAVVIRETEPLARTTAFHGVRLGMTHDEVAELITPKVEAPRPNTQEIYVFPDTRQLIVNYDGWKNAWGKAIMLELKPALGRAHGIFAEMRERFGFPDVNDESDDRLIWRGQDGIRLVVQIKHTFGNRRFPDEFGCLIDGDRISDLDKQLNLEKDD